MKNCYSYHQNVTRSITKAATERDIREMLARDQEARRAKPKRHTEAGTKMAKDILHHYKFPGDEKSKPENDPE